MKKEKFKELVEKNLHVLEGYEIDKNGKKKMHIVGIEKLYEQLNIHSVSQQRELFYNFITWYNAKAKIDKNKDGLITTNVIEEYLKL